MFKQWFESKNKITLDGDCYTLNRQESPSSINQISFGTEMYDSADKILIKRCVGRADAIRLDE